MRTMSMVVLMAFSGVLVLAGCTTAGRGYIAPGEAAGYELERTPAAPAELSESLFAEDQKVISNEDIQRILTAKITLPRDGKLAVIRAGRLPYWFGWSEDFTRLNRETDRQVLEKLQSSQRVREAVYLPTMAIPRELSIPYLRQAAARFQADLVLVYRTYSRTYERQKLFGQDQTHAYCTLEALLIDTRTGVIPFSTIVTEDFSAKRAKGDVDFNETVAKAEQQAIGKAQMQMAEQVVAFSNQLSQEQAAPPQQ
jgi:hypothetical protein